jgi:hypothetical protein
VLRPGHVRLDLVISRALRREVARLERQVERLEQCVPVNELGQGNRQSIDSGPNGGQPFAT